MTPAWDLLTAAAAVWALLALPTLAAGLVGWDPVGRIGGAGLGGRVDSRWGWFLMELPALAAFPAVYLASGNWHPVGNVALALWLAHYGHRTLLWPWLVQKPGATVSVAMCAAAAGFNLINGGLVGWFMGHGAGYAAHWPLDPRFIGGLVLMLGGAALNVWADYRLLHQRRTAGGRPVLPRGGAFRVVACPNLAGEVLEWVGFALLTWCMPALAFALWTVANLLPRALWRRDWYRATFPDFPPKRAALLPGVI